MQCTGYSVVRGTDVRAFGVEVIDVVDDRASGTGPRILVQGVGAGGRRDRDRAGLLRLADLLPRRRRGRSATSARSRSRSASTAGRSCWRRRSRRSSATPSTRRRPSSAGATLARARPLAAPLTVTGLEHAARRARCSGPRAKRGRLVLAAPAGPLGSFPRPAAARPARRSPSATRRATSPRARSAPSRTPTRDRVWGFGHPLDGVGARALLLQDAYVFRVVNNPRRDRRVGRRRTSTPRPGTTSARSPTTRSTRSSGASAALPATIPVRVFATDLDTGAKRTVATNVADESARRPADRRLDPLASSRRSPSRRPRARCSAARPRG